jgi:hypothetical protein
MGEKFTLDLDLLRPGRLRCSWFDPRYGSFHHVLTTDTRAIQTYSPPTAGRGCDWVLLLEDEAAGR